MRGKIKHGKKIAFLFFLMALNTAYGNFNEVINEAAQDVASMIDSSSFDLFRIFRGGRPSDPSHFGNF